MDNINEGAKSGQNEMPRLGRVVGYADSTYMGRLRIELLHTDSGDNNETSPGQTISADMISPFWGNTNERCFAYSRSIGSKIPVVF